MFDFLQLVAVTDPTKGSRGGLSVFIVDTNTPGVSIVGRTEHMMGDVTFEIALDDVKVPVENRVGEEGDGMKHAQGFINTNRIHQACHGLGVAQRCLEMITSYTQQRVTFGRPVAERQSAQCDARSGSPRVSRGCGRSVQKYGFATRLAVKSLSQRMIKS